MKTFFVALFLTLNVYAEVSLQDCLDDAQLNGNHVQAVAPLPECANIVNSETSKVEVSSGIYRAYGKDHIIYFDTKDGSGNVIERVLLAGDQTELLSVQKVFIDTSSRRLYVIQLKNTKNELMVFNLDFLGNVTPLNVMRSDTAFVGVISVKAEGADQIEVINAQGSFLINADAESRTTRSVQKELTVTPK